MEDRERDRQHQFSAEAQAIVALSPSSRELLAADRARLAALGRESEAVAALAAKSFPSVFPAFQGAKINALACSLEVTPAGVTVRALVKGRSPSPLQAVAQHAAAAAGVFVAEELRKEDPSVKLLEIRPAGPRRIFELPAGRRLRAGVIVLSDSRASGEHSDESGPIIRSRLESFGILVEQLQVIPDDAAEFERLVLQAADELALDLIVSSGGTGLGPRDLVPEVTARLVARVIPGVSEAIRAHGQRHTRQAMLSRGLAGVRGATLVLNLPGSPAGVAESLDAVMPELLQVFTMMNGGGHS